ncbi:MAG: metallopeptidase [Verrucomicrobiales bacterium]|nr:metallopeptidase [Verrucomicrobiales bacterium]|tara:strand:+ start:358 stop:1068 length:711 start_codon:yes stop_codon:yes gene_type:complete
MTFRLLTLLTLLAAALHAAPDKERFYKPIQKNVEGWNIAVDPELLEPKHKAVADKAFTALANHLQRVKFILHEAKVKELQKLPIRLEYNNDRLGNMQYHPSVSWLRINRHDPALAKHVHLPRAKSLFDPHMWAKHPYVVLHELAHAYHDQVLGFDNKEIMQAYEAAKKEGIYEKVLLYTGRRPVKHYGLNNHKEYFAESTEAYLGVNDFYPFVRAELKEHDPRMYKIMEKIWGPIR